MSITRAHDADALVGKRIKRRMAELRMTQGDVATELGISQSALSLKMVGKNRWTLADLIGVSEILRVPLPELVWGLPQATRLPRLDSNQEPAG